MRTCAIVNPVAGRGAVHRMWPTLEDRLKRSSDDLSVLRTIGPNDATALTRSALRAGVERIVCVGGDGTLHEVVNGFFAEDGTRLSESACLALIPCGTGTDFRRSLGIPYGLEAASLLEEEQRRSIDLLRVDYTCAAGHEVSCYAVNITSFGLSSDVARNIKQGDPRWVPGPLRYFGALLRALLSQRPVPVHLTVDQSPLASSAVHLVAVANGHTFGGGIRIAPRARFDDGLLDVIILEDRSVLSLLPHLHRFYRGTHPSLEGVTTLQGRTVTAHPCTEAPVRIEADGELLGRLPMRIEIVPEALQVQC